MIPLRHILSMPVCSGFRVVSGFNGIGNIVASTAFFDCEEEFCSSEGNVAGKIIITTLGAARNDQELAEKNLRLLIRSGAAAIAIRNTYFSDVSEQVKKLSDKQNVPLIFFNFPGIDDVLYGIRSCLDHIDRNDAANAVSSLLSCDSLDDSRVLSLAFRLSPYLRDNVILCSYITDKYDGKCNTYADALPIDAWQPDSIHVFPRLADCGARYVFIPYRHGIFFILTAEDPENITEDITLSFLKELLPTDIDDSRRIGHSSSQVKLSSLHIPLREALYANVSSILDDYGVTWYNQLRLDKLLCSARAFEVSKELLNDLLQKLVSSGGRNNSEDFSMTLDTYVACNGDIKATASAMHQHPNTIRYRLAKIQSAWSCNNIFYFNAIALLFVRLRGILRLLSDI